MQLKPIYTMSTRFLVRVACPPATFFLPGRFIGRREARQA